MKCDVPIAWSPVRRQRNEAYHMKINDLVQNVIQTYKAKRRPLDELQPENDVEEGEETEATANRIPVVAETAEPPVSRMVPKSSGILIFACLQKALGQTML